MGWVSGGGGAGGSVFSGGGGRGSQRVLGRAEESQRVIRVC